MAETVKKTSVKAEETVKIKLPRLSGKKNDEGEFVSVNERTWLIKRGVEVEVPLCVAELIRNQELMEDEAEAFNSAVVN